MIFKTKSGLIERLLKNEKWKVKDMTCFYDDDSINPFKVKHSDGTIVHMGDTWKYCNGKTQWERVYDNPEEVLTIINKCLTDLDKRLSDDENSYIVQYGLFKKVDSKTVHIPFCPYTF